MKKSDKAKLVVAFLKGSKLFMLLVVVFAGVMSLADMISPQIIRIAVDNVIYSSAPKSGSFTEKFIQFLGGISYLKQNMWVLALILAFAAFLRGIGVYFFRVFNTKASETLAKTMRDTMFSHIERLPFSWYAKNHTGDIIQRCTSDIDMVRNFISEQVKSLIHIIITALFSFAFMVSVSGRLTLYSILPMPLIVAYSFLFHKNIGKGFRECDENEGKLSAMVQENLTGVRVVRAFGREKHEVDRFEKQNTYYTSLWEKLAKTMSKFWSISDILSGIQVMLVIVIGSVMCTNDEITVGAFLAFISYNAYLISPIRQLGRTLSEMSKASVSLERISDIMSASREEEQPDALRPNMHGDIEFSHVSFYYEAGKEVLHDINFKMKQGSVLGILGGTGSGKTTMMLLLDKLYAPQKGSIKINGTDIQNINTGYLRSNIGMVLQEPFLFSRSIKDNIALANENASFEEIREAARTACFDDTVMSFLNGYDTFVGERGVTLSGGQKQRANIARMILQKAPIMVFDDSLSAVDTQTDEKIRRRLKRHFKNASVIIISHRINTLSSADKILVLENGSIVEQGTHDELKHANGPYSEIYRLQSAMGRVEE